MNAEKMLFKIEMLMRKTVENGCSPSEAAIAANLVQDLLKKYKLSISDIKTSEKEDINIEIIPVSREWHALLFNEIARNMCCKCHRQVVKDRSASMICLGRVSDIVAVKKLYNSLLEIIKHNSLQVKRKAKIEFNTMKGVEVAYARAFISVVAKTMSMKQKALMLIPDQEVEDQYKEKYKFFRVKKLNPIYYYSKDAIDFAKYKGKQDGNEAMRIRSLT